MIVLGLPNNRLDVPVISSIGTPGLDYDGDICVKFYYHMYGRSMGTLGVYRSSRPDDPLLEIEGDQGNSWQLWSLEANINRGERVRIHESISINQMYIRKRKNC